MGFADMIRRITKHLPLMIVKHERREIKTIAIYYMWLSDCGGIETYIESAISLFKDMGYNVVLITTTPREKIRIDISGARLEVISGYKISIGTPIKEILAYEEDLRRILLRNKVDLFYTQDWAHWISLFDLLTANECGCFTLMHYHNNPLAMKRTGSNIWNAQYKYIKYFDYCISLSRSA